MGKDITVEEDEVQNTIIAFGKSESSPILIVILGLIPVSIIMFIPIVGFIVSFCLSIIGWGVVLRTKFGTTESIFKRTS